MWYGYPIHEAIAIQQSKSVLKEAQLGEEFFSMGHQTLKLKHSNSPPSIPEGIYP